MQENNKENILELCKLYKDESTITLTDKTIKTINEWSDYQMLGIVLLLNVDRKRHGGLLVDLHDNYVIGNNNYPGTFTEAFSLLLNYRKKKGKVK